MGTYNPNYMSTYNLLRGLSEAADKCSSNWGYKYLNLQVGFGASGACGFRAVGLA